MEKDTDSEFQPHMCVCARVSVNKFTSLEKIKPDAGCRLIGGGGREEEQGQEQEEVHFTTP